MPRLSLSLSLVLGSLLLSQCWLKKSDPQPAAPALPPVTQTGAGTIGFRVDGQVWLPKGSFHYPAALAYYSGKMFYITANQVGGNTRDQFGISINPMDPSQTTWDLAERYNVGCNFGRFTDSYRVIKAGAGTLRITRLDTVAHIVAGTFEFEAVSVISGKTVRVTDGRFDLTTN